MVFVKVKEIKGRLYKYLVKGYRVNGKVKHKTVKYLGAVEPVNKKRKRGGGRKPHLFVRELSEQEKKFVGERLRSNDGFVRDRARVVFHSGEGETVQGLCKRTGLHRSRVEKLIRDFNKRGLEVFKRKASSGRPRRITAEERAKIIQFVNTDPRTLGKHFTSWSLNKLTRYVQEQGITASVSQVRRVIKSDGKAFKTKRKRLYSNDPNFFKKNSSLTG